MRTKDYEDITVSEICEHAGYNRGTFYKNFGDKDGLLNQVITNKLEGMSTVLIDLTKLFIPEVDKSYKKEILVKLFEVIGESHYFFRTVLKYNKIKGFRYELFKTIQSHLKELSEVINLFGDELNEDVHFFVSMYYTAGIVGIICSWVQEYSEYDSTYVAEQFCEILELDINNMLKIIIPLKHRALVIGNDIDPRVQRSKKAFVQALIEQLKTKSLEEIKISDIADQAGYNRSTFYTHFTSKQELYEYLIDDFVNGLILILIDSDDFRIGNPIPIIFDYVYEKRVLLDIVYKKNKIPGFFNQLYSKLKTILMEELEGKLRVNHQLYAEYIVSTLLTFIGSWISMRPKFSSDYMSNLFLAFSNPERKNEKQALQ